MHETYREMFQNLIFDKYATLLKFQKRDLVLGNNLNQNLFQRLSSRGETSEPDVHRSGQCAVVLIRFFAPASETHF